MATPAISTTQVFTHEVFGEIRTIFENGEIKFIAKDCCRALGISRPSYSMTRLADDEKGIHLVATNGGPQSTIVVTEAGLRQLIYQSSRMDTKKFYHWIWHEVIPAIHQQYGNEPSTASVTPESELDTNYLLLFAIEVDELRAKSVELAKTVDEKAQQLADVLTKNVELEVKVDIQAKRLKDALTKNKELEATVDAQAQQIKKYEGIVEPLVNLADAIAAFDKPAVVFQSIAQKGAK